MRKFVLRLQQFLRRNWDNQHPARHLQSHQRHSSRPRGFTLTEVMIASVLISVVILVAWTGFISALNLSQTAQAKTARQLELNAALDVMSTEVRRAQSINRSEAIAANGTTITVKDVVESTGLDLKELGPYGEISLYLEIPTNRLTTTCPTAGGPVIADAIDRVVYDVRPSPDGWLAPNAMVRYGRLPGADGSIDPCSVPIANDIMADSLTNNEKEPQCTGILTGADGFHTCTKGDNVELLLKSAIEGLDEKSESRSVTPRQASFAPIPEAPQKQPGLLLSATYSDHEKGLDPAKRGFVDLTWRWSGKEVDLRYQKLEAHVVKEASPWPYSVHIQDGDKTKLVHVGDPPNKTGINMQHPFETIPGNACFVVEGKTPEQEVVKSNQVCVVNGDIQVTQ